MMLQRQKSYIWILFGICAATMAMKFVPPYTMLKYHSLSGVYALASLCCIYIGSNSFGWSATKKQKASIAIYVSMLFSAFYVIAWPTTYLPTAINIAFAIPVFFAPVLSAFVMPLLLALSHKSMASKNNWLIYLLAWGPIFDFAAKAVSI
jgi:hypothetical protein